MKIEQKVKQHDELIAELIKMQQDGNKRLRIMENVQAVAIPVCLILGAAGLLALIRAFAIF